MDLRILLFALALSACSAPSEAEQGDAQSASSASSVSITLTEDDLARIAAIEISERVPGATISDRRKATTSPSICGRLKLADGSLVPFQFSKADERQALVVPLGIEQGRVSDWDHVAREAQWMGVNCADLGAAIAKPEFALPQ